jgi:hypothetical protein
MDTVTSTVEALLNESSWSDSHCRASRSHRPGRRRLVTRTVTRGGHASDTATRRHRGARARADAPSQRHGPGIDWHSDLCLEYHLYHMHDIIVPTKSNI